MSGGRVVSVAGSLPGSVLRGVYPGRTTRHTKAPITRVHMWGFKSLRPLPPLQPQLLSQVSTIEQSCMCKSHFVAVHV